MTKKTQPYKNQTFAGSVAAGLGSIFNAKGKKYYILEHKITSKYHKAGEWQEIIVDNIELGRSGKCQVQFDESFSTVSARHAAIVKEGDNWKLVQLSKTNSTLLNGKKVEKEWYLQNGDEIQLSVNGPKLGFIIPTGAKSTVGTIGLTRRLSLFRQQALRPYKTAITALSIILLLSVGELGYKIYLDQVEQERLIAAFNDAQVKHAEEIQKLEDDAQKRADEAKKERDEAEKRAKEREQELTDKLDDLEKQHKQDQAKLNQVRNDLNKAKRERNVYDGAPDEELKPFVKDVLFLHVSEVRIYDNSNNYVTLRTKDKKALGWMGTAFLCDDGKVVTAQHCVNGWLFSPEDVLEELDEESIQYFIAALYHPNDLRFESIINLYNAAIELPTMKSSQFKTGGYSTVKDNNGNNYITCTKWHQDWAYANTIQKGSIKRGPGAATKLKAGQKLKIMGYPLGVGGADRTRSEIVCRNSSCVVAHGNGLVDGIIETADNNSDQGNSGGPVFCKNEDGSVLCVGIISYGVGSKGKIGGLVSVSELK